MRRGFAALEALNCGKPINAVLNDEIPPSSIAGASSPARCATCMGTVAWRISARPYLDDVRVVILIGIVGFDRAVELPADDDGLEAGARHRRG